jgi:hypothetical protein
MKILLTIMIMFAIIAYSLLYNNISDREEKRKSYKYEVSYSIFEGSYFTNKIIKTDNCISFISSKNYEYEFCGNSQVKTLKKYSKGHIDDENYPRD